MIKLSAIEFIKRSKNTHGDKYDYSLVEYINNRTKVKIICPKHEVFEQTPYSHYSGCGCPKCVNNYKKTFVDFVKESNKIHHYKYKYVDYTNDRTKSTIICPEHGEFEQIPNSHLRGSGCPKCVNNYKKNKESFIKNALNIHSNKYDYNLVNYRNNLTKVKIICPEHGEFEQTPNNHLSKKQGCPECVNKLLGLEEFINISNKIHNGYYDYSLSEYKDSRIKIKIICPEHGEFEQTPNSHLSGHGCSSCNLSKGEKKVREYLESNNIKYIEQYKFNDCVHKNKLKFDFYLPDSNTAIEYDGIQHFKPIDYFGGYLGFKETKKRDYIKNEYCEMNKINLIRIGFEGFEDIYQILNEKITEYL